jgi:phosphomannomutase
MADLDKVFKAYDIRGKYPQDIDEDLAWKVGHAAGQFLRSMLTGYERGQASSNRMVVGQDMRPHSKDLVKALIEGITSTGTACVDIGLCDTPMVSFAINHLGSCGGIQVTASHNPVEDNGFKISGFKAKPIGQNSGLNEIKRIAASLRRMPLGASVAPVHQVNLWEDYRKHVLAFLKLARPLRVVVDASNGVAGKMVPEIFRGTDLDIIPLNFQIGQGFAHSLNPLEEATLSQLKAALREQPADFGVCFDGDADRCVFVDEQSQPVRSDLMTALLARRFLKDNPGAMVVYDLRSSRAVSEEIRAAGGVPRRERVGHAFMKKALAEGHGVFGGELSGHFYFRDNFNADSGAIALATAASVVAASDKPFSGQIAPLLRYSHSGEINFEAPDKQAKMDEIVRTFADAKVDYLDGVTVEYEDWWCNVRPSNTEPLLRLNLEAKDASLMRQKLRQVEKILGRPAGH